MGRIGLYAKISLLVLGLVIVIFAIRSMNTEKVEGAFQALGIQEGTSKSAAGTPAGGDSSVATETERTLCRTRVHSLKFPNGDSIYETKEGMTLVWMSETAENAGTPRTLSYLEVEMWFSKHCKFMATPAGPLENPEPSNEPVKYVQIEFVDGSTWDIYREGDAFVSGSDPKDRFMSEDLDQAIAELRSIAGFPVDSDDR